MSDELTEAERAELELDLQDYWHEADLTGPPLDKVIASVVRIKAAARRETLEEAADFVENGGDYGYGGWAAHDKRTLAYLLREKAATES